MLEIYPDVEKLYRYLAEAGNLHQLKSPLAARRREVFFQVTLRGYAVVIPEV